MNFCNQCGHKVELRIPEGDTLPRHICNNCGTIHYQNPNIVAGCLPILDNKVLLCKRAIEPRLGKWTLPAGFMENNETLEEAALRESTEEANANIEIEDLYTIISLPYINQVYMMFRGHLRDTNFSPGAESLEVKLFHEHEIPWQDLAFRTIEYTLLRYFEEQPTGKFNLHRHVLYRGSSQRINASA